jgi:hypothetical protein
MTGEVPRPGPVPAGRVASAPPAAGLAPRDAARPAAVPPHGTEPGGWRRLPLRDIALAWCVTRIVTGAAYALARYLAGQLAAVHPASGGPVRLTGLLGWDAGWYAGIAGHGYAGVGGQGLRFFPLLPLLVRAVTVLPGLGGHPGITLVVMVNVLAFGFVAALAWLARAEGLDAAATSRLVWITSLAPPAFVLVMGYTEAVWGLLAVGVFAGLRTRRWEAAALCGLLAGLCRPVGILLALPAAVEATRGITTVTLTQGLRRVAAVTGPVAGCALFGVWAQIAYADALLPVRIQRQAALHGSASNPAAVLWTSARGITHGQVGTALHVPWIVLVVLLLVVMVRTLPASYPLWAAATIAVVLTGSNLDSSERYAFGTFPFLMVAAGLTRGDTVLRIVLAVNTALLVVYAALAFLGLYVP